uniref:COesterase domain-containing protein n=1 Tax=Macrostomum lignano TaxID=282301 RepID=A0A1I8GKA6_9PLAT
DGFEVHQRRRTNQPRPLLPVLVFVHGDSYLWGSGNAYDLSMLCAISGAIGITLNYRLGSFGFLSADGLEAPGNFALMDLRDALQWVRANIRQFGGDPDRVTLMGHGYGAALASLLMISRFAQ